MRKTLWIIVAIAVLGTISVYALPRNDQVETGSSQTETNSSVNLSTGSTAAETNMPEPTLTSSVNESTGLNDGTYTGDVSSNQFGTVQVAINIIDGKISNVEFLSMPDGDSRSTAITDYAQPILLEDTLSVQSADIDTISGATYTTLSYIESLQSAIDQASLKMRRIHQTMGTVASVDIVGGHEVIFNEIFELFDYINEHFSVYNNNSEISRYNSGQIKQPSADLKDLLYQSARYHKKTVGFFSANFDGRFNPTGLVKGWAIKKAGELLQTKGFNEYMINIGGDILTRSSSQKLWQIGLQHPVNQRAIMFKIAAGNLAVATSGTYERGEHIINPHSKQPVNEIISATVFGSDIVMADVLATTVCAMGKQGIDFIKKQASFEAIIIDKALKVFVTKNLSGLGVTTVQNAL